MIKFSFSILAQILHKQYYKLLTVPYQEALSVNMLFDYLFKSLIYRHLCHKIVTFSLYLVNYLLDNTLTPYEYPIPKKSVTP